MDVQNNQTQELFEKLYVKNAPSWALELDSDGSYKYHATQSAFSLFEQQQAEIELLKSDLAKSQAVPEGFVLVPVETLNEALSWANCASNESWSDAQREEIDKHYEVIENAMIEAQSVPKGFVLVPTSLSDKQYNQLEEVMQDNFGTTVSQSRDCIAKIHNELVSIAQEPTND